MISLDVIILFMMLLFSCCVAHPCKSKLEMFECRILQLTGTNHAHWPKQGNIQSKLCSRLAWPAPNPVSMPGSSNAYQMALSSGREGKKGTQQENKTEVLVLNMSLRYWAQSNLQCIQHSLHDMEACLMLSWASENEKQIAGGVKDCLLLGCQTPHQVPLTVR